MYLGTSGEMKALDRLAIDSFGLPGIVLMENAARSIYQESLQFWPKWPNQPAVALLIGPGQNGGDGWALARIFSAVGFAVQCFLIKRKDQDIRGDAAINYAVAQKLSIPIEVISESETEIPDWRQYDLIIDALFGTGLDRTISNPAARILESLAATKLNFPGGDKLRILAVDLPSGLSGDTGELWGPPLAADLTVTLGLPKVGLYLGHGPALAGEVRVGDIGLVPSMINQIPPQGRLVDIGELLPHLPRRPADGHKGTFGRVFLAGGSQGHTGALVLSAMGAARSGAGLITALHPASLSPIYGAKLTEAMSLELPEEAPGEVSAQAGASIVQYASQGNALGIGPGFGLGEGATRAVRQVMDNSTLPLVLDADALTHLATFSGPTNFAQRQVILTPHPGEAARLLGVSNHQIQKDRLGAARAIASQREAVVILKGQNSLIVEPSGQFYLNPNGGPHLAVGGSGDLLTGLTTGLLAQKMPAFQAATLAAWLHGRAGDLARASLGPCGLTPFEVAQFIPKAWQELRGD